jgi:hypothetical protein
LELRRNEIGDEGARALASSANLPALTSLNLLENNVSEESRSALPASMGLRGCQLLL